MDSRERLLAAINNEKPDRLPVQVHNWMPYYLKTYLGGIDQYAAYERFGMDAVIYVGPNFIYDERDLADWQIEHKDLGTDESGNHVWMQAITTPKGTLTQRGAWN